MDVLEHPVLPFTSITSPMVNKELYYFGTFLSVNMVGYELELHSSTVALYLQ